jgi:mitosis inhibitor protein kinase SWE1
LRQEDFMQVDVPTSRELFDLIKHMMRMEPGLRISTEDIYLHPVVSRARTAMERIHSAAVATGTSLFAASPLASVSAGFLEEILGDGVSRMDLSL